MRLFGRPHPIWTRRCTRDSIALIAWQPVQISFSTSAGWDRLEPLRYLEGRRAQKIGGWSSKIPLFLALLAAWPNVGVQTMKPADTNDRTLRLLPLWNWYFWHLNVAKTIGWLVMHSCVIVDPMTCLAATSSDPFLHLLSIQNEWRSHQPQAILCLWANLKMLAREQGKLRWWRQ